VETNKFRNKNGDLSIYAFGCGYVQEHGDFVNGTCTRLYKDGGPGWHIRTTFPYGSGGSVWEVYETLTAARRAYREQIKKYHGAKA